MVSVVCGTADQITPVAPYGQCGEAATGRLDAGRRRIVADHQPEGLRLQVAQGHGDRLIARRQQCGTGRGERGEREVGVAGGRRIAERADLVGPGVEQGVDAAILLARPALAFTGTGQHIDEMQRRAGGAGGAQGEAAGRGDVQQDIGFAGGGESLAVQGSGTVGDGGQAGRRLRGGKFRSGNGLRGRRAGRGLLRRSGRRRDIRCGCLAMWRVCR